MDIDFPNETQIPGKYIKRHSISLATWETQVEAVWGVHLITVQGNYQGDKEQHTQGVAVCMGRRPQTLPVGV